MGHAAALTPRWVFKPKSRAESLSPTAGSIAFVDHDGNVVPVDAKGKAQLAVPLSTTSSHRPARMLAHPLGDAWLVWAVGSEDGDTELSLVRQGRKKAQPFTEGDLPIQACFVSVDGIAVARSASVELWTHAGKRKWMRKTEGAHVAVALSGATFLALSEEGALTSYSVVSGEPKESLRLAGTEPASTWRLALAGRERALLALGEHIVVVDTATMKVVRRIKTRGNITHLVADAEGAIAGFADGWVQAIDLKSGDAAPPLHAHENAEVLALALDKTTLYSTCGLRLCAWERASLGVLPASQSPVTAISSFGGLVVAGDRAGLLRILANGDEVGRLSLGQEVTALRAVSETTVVAVTTRALISLSAPWKLPRIISLRSPATAFTADAGYAFVGTLEGAVDVYDLTSDSHVTRYSLSEADVSALALLPGGKLAVGTGAIDGRVFIVDAVAAEVRHRVEAHDEAFGVTCIAAEPRGRLVASGSDDGSVALIDPGKGKVLARIRLPETPASIAFEASGKRFICTFADGKAAVVDLADRAKVLALDLRGATHVTWGTSPMFGHADGRVAAYSV